MSLAFATLCQSKIHHSTSAQDRFPTQSNNPTPTNNKIPEYPVSVLAALGELTLGLPLDRIKIGLQSGLSFTEILKPTQNSAGETRGTQSCSPSNAIPRNLLARTRTSMNLSYWFAGVPTRFRTSMGYWFAGHTPSIINRCFIYLPGIAYLNTGYTQHVEPWICFAGGCPRLASQAIVKPILVSALITPYVSMFEGLKLTQQLGHQKVYPPEINKFINIGRVAGQQHSPSTTTQAPTTYQPSTYQLIKGVINSGRGGILFASFWPTFARETLFISGMCVVQPLVAKYLAASRQIDNPETARVLGSLTASFACQTISQPFDVLKTRREIMPAADWSQILDLVKTDIKNKGTRPVLFSGWLPRCVRGVWTFYSVSAIRDWLNK